MTNAEVNIPLLRKAVEWAEAEAAKPAIDSRWNQASWVSDAREIAGILADAVIPDDEPEFDSRWVKVRENLMPHCGTAFCVAGYVAQLEDPRYAEGGVVDGVRLSAFAANALGINPPDPVTPEKGHLFYGGNSIEDVRRIAEDLAGERL